MKHIKFLLAIVGLFAFVNLQAQIKVGTNPTTMDPSSILEVESTTKGFLPPRMTETERDDIANPAKGLVIFNLTEDCLQINEGTSTAPAWVCLSGATSGDPSTNGTAVVTNYGNATCDDPSQGSISGTMTRGVAVSGVTMTLYANVVELGTWSLSATENGVTFTGSGTFTTLGCQPITLTGSGTPTSSGTFTWCTDSTPQGCSPAPVLAQSDPSSGIAVGVGNLTGNTCFDIALSNTPSCGTVSSRIATQADFTQTSTHTQTYTFTPSGSVSNLRFYYVNDAGSAIIAITGGNSGNSISSAQTATVNFDTNLNTLALGLNNTTALKSRIIAVYNINPTNNNNPADDRELTLNVSIKDCSCCRVKISATAYREFLCHNLGADISLDPHTPNVGLVGAKVQWGVRGPNITGNSVIDWQTAPNDSRFVAAPTATNANLGPIVGWSTSNPSSTWNDFTKTFRDPCPAGYRVPTLQNWSDVIANNVVTRTGPFVESFGRYDNALHFGPDPFTKALTLPTTGIGGAAGQSNTATEGWYWTTSTLISTATPDYFRFNETETFGRTGRYTGLAIRCIAGN
jgi:hypothetical protein